MRQRICDRIGILNTELVAIGTPEELERSVGPRKTEIQLEQVNDVILDSLKKLSVGKISHDDSKLTIELDDPYKKNPLIVRTIVEAGGNVQTVTVSRSSLEEAYLKLVREKE
jgi:ABC-2 type transport system ATP-binding protein